MSYTKPSGLPPPSRQPTLPTSRETLVPFDRRNLYTNAIHQNVLDEQRRAELRALAWLEHSDV